MFYPLNYQGKDQTAQIKQHICLDHHSQSWWTIQSRAHGRIRTCDSPLRRRVRYPLRHGGLCGSHPHHGAYAGQQPGRALWRCPRCHPRGEVRRGRGSFRAQGASPGRDAWQRRDTIPHRVLGRNRTCDLSVPELSALAIGATRTLRPGYQPLPDPDQPHAAPASPPSKGSWPTMLGSPPSVPAMSPLCPQQDSNLRPRPSEGRALPLSYEDKVVRRAEDHPPLGRSAP